MPIEKMKSNEIKIIDKNDLGDMVNRVTGQR